MCGIFAAISFKDKFSFKDFEIFKRQTDLVSYRGPDASGYISFNEGQLSTTNNEFDIFLGHRRLSIIDLSASANQPFFDDSQCIIYNGEIFNYIEIKQELQKKGHIFRTDSDTEVILKVYKEYGESGFSLLNGMWAFVIVDNARRRIVISRDRFSIKPLYFTQVDSKFYFSSEIKQILPFVTAKRINRNSLNVFLKQALIDHNEETFFENIFKIKPKTNFVIDLNDKKYFEKEYWNYSKSLSKIRLPQR